MSTRDETLIGMINEYLATHDVLVSTHNFLTQLKSTIKALEVAETDQEVADNTSYSEMAVEHKATEQIEENQPIAGAAKIIISCDASIKKNPGGPSSVGVIIRIPGQEQPLKVSHVTKSTTNNQAEYDAVYSGITTLLDTHNRPRYPVVIRSDSQLVIKGLKKEITVKDKKLLNKRDIILEVASKIEMGVTFEWRPRNSTEDLKQANFLAQDKLGVPRH